jgi:NitT/TauT family transport system ATP-binding protein
MTNPRSTAIAPEAEKWTEVPRDAARPARIKEIIDVPFAYPRDESLQERAEFGELRGHIRELVMSEYRAQQALVQPASFSE